MLRQIEALNGIRGFAVLLVLLSHASNDHIVFLKGVSFSGAGRYGVFLFFVLSAFLLTGQFLDLDADGRNIGEVLKRYFYRRFIRIYPLFTVTLILYYILYTKGLLIIPITGEMIVQSLLLVDAAGLFWTVPVEFQYYFILPLVALVIKKKQLSVVLIVGILFCLIWTYFFPPKYINNVIPFLPIFIIGSLAAIVHRTLDAQNRQRKNPLRNRMYNIISLLFMISFFIFIPSCFNVLFSSNVGRTFFHNQFVFFAFLSAGLILMTLASNGAVRMLMESKFFVFWGKVSFSAYLGHKIVLALMLELRFLPSSAKFFLFFLFTALFSFLSYRFFERPLAKMDFSAVAIKENR